jgi:hypothetical protein
MGSLSTNEERKLAYFHALSKVMTEGNQNVYESKYKSSHNVRLNEVWSDDIGFAIDYSTAVLESISNSAVTLYSTVTLTEIPGSNGQVYYYNSGGTFIRPWISPVDVPNSITNEPSDGYQVKLFKGDNTEIYLTQGAWAVDYYAGIIHFAVGYTPTDLGWGAIKASFFQYSGNFGSSGGTTNVLTTVEFNSGTSQLVFNSGETTETIIDLSSLSGGTTNAFTTVEFNSGTSELVFNSGETTQSIIDLSTLSGGTSTFTAVFDSGTSMLIFNSGETTETMVDLSALSGGTMDAYTTVSFNSGTSMLVFNSGQTTETLVDLSVLSGGTENALIYATFNESSSTLIFNSGETTPYYVDLSSLKSVTGTTSLMTTINTFARNTSNFARLACDLNLPNNLSGSTVIVFINGIQVSVGNLPTDDCYFSPDGITKRSIGTEAANDELYWNYDGGGKAVSGYDLSTIDKITFLNLKI